MMITFWMLAVAHFRNHWTSLWLNYWTSLACQQIWPLPPMWQFAQDLLETEEMQCAVSAKKTRALCVATTVDMNWFCQQQGLCPRTDRHCRKLFDPVPFPKQPWQFLSPLLIIFCSKMDHASGQRFPLSRYLMFHSGDHLKNVYN